MFRKIAVLGLLVCVSRVHSAEFLGGLYATTQDDRLIRFNADGSFATVLTGLPDPKGLEFRDSNAVYMTYQTYQSGSEWGSLGIWNADGIRTFYADGVPATNRFSNGTYAAGVAVDVDGTAYVATHNSPGLTRVELDGTITDFTGYAPELWWGRQAAISPSGRLVTSNWTVNGVYEVDKLTGQTSLIAPGLAEGGGIAFDDADNLYISEFVSNTVWKLEPNGSLNPLTSIVFPNYSAFGNGTLYVSDFDLSVGFTRIWEVDVTSGAATLFATNLPRLDDVAFLNAAVPEPTTWVYGVIGAAIGLLALLRRR